jgi:Protein of unknown function (DUF4011)
MLYLVFGFLEWYESDDSQQPHLAPLVILPVTIERAGGKVRRTMTWTRTTPGTSRILRLIDPT